MGWAGICAGLLVLKHNLWKGQGVPYVDFGVRLGWVSEVQLRFYQIYQIKVEPKGG